MRWLLKFYILPIVSTSSNDHCDISIVLKETWMGMYLSVGVCADIR